MLDWIKANHKGFGIAVVLHLIFFGALLFNWQMDKPDKIVLEQGDVIQVSSVDANTYEAEIRKIEEKKRADERKKQQRIKQKKAAAKRKEQQRIKKKQQEKKRKAEEKKKADAKKKEQKRKAEQLKEKQRKAVEKKEKDRQAAEIRKKEAAEKKAVQEKKQQEAEQKRQAEQEKKRQAELKRQQQRDRAEWERKSKGIINRHAALIQRKIEQNWRQPLDVPSNLKCRINIILQPTGKVVSVRILDSSGSQPFDRSVETAVRKASPLPVPENREIFEQFRDLNLSFEPGSY